MLRMPAEGALELLSAVNISCIGKDRTLNENSRFIILEFLLAQLQVSTQLLKSEAAICAGAVSTHTPQTLQVPGAAGGTWCLLPRRFRLPRKAEGWL